MTAKDWVLTSSAFDDGSAIPRKYTGEGEDVSPPLAWTAPPEGAVSLVLICDDPDAPRGTWNHWLLWNLPPDLRSLPEAVPTRPDLTEYGGAVQGTNDFGRIGYGGPMPPPGSSHRYYFRLYALDSKLNLPARVRRGALDMAMEGHVLAETHLMGRYSR